MSTCCSPDSPARHDGDAYCPLTGARGRIVPRRTLEALLTADAAARLGPGTYRLCPDPLCDVVYFGDGGVFIQADVRVPVWHKAPSTSPLCYCLGESEVSIRSEISAVGCSGAESRVRQAIAAGRCACEVRNPTGACCLGEVAAAVRRFERG
jgi:hypothetical protein